VAYDDVVAREAAWFTTEPPFTGCPPLISSAGGPFDLVQGYLRQVTDRGRDLYVLREKTVNSRISMGGEKESLHSMLLIVWWPVTKSKLEAEQQALDTAVAAVLTRIIGPFGDKTHTTATGAFSWVGEDGKEISVEPQNFVANLFAGGPFETHIRYSAADVFGA
jgi:hypothetical protein